MSCCVKKHLDKKHLDILNLLSKSHPFQQRALLETAEPDQVRAICECIYNIMHGNILIPEGIKVELAPRKKNVVGFCRYKLPYKIKKEIPEQSGG